MERKNNLSNKLKSIQTEMRKSQTEFAQELGIPQSTLQNIMKEGNTTVDTLVRISTATGFSLDELVFDDPTNRILCGLEYYSHMTAEQQEEVKRHIYEI